MKGWDAMNVFVRGESGVGGEEDRIGERGGGRSRFRRRWFS